MAFWILSWVVATNGMLKAWWSPNVVLQHNVGMSILATYLQRCLACRVTSWQSFVLCTKHTRLHICFFLGGKYSKSGSCGAKSIENKRFTCCDKQIKRTGARSECWLSWYITVSEFLYRCILKSTQYVYVYKKRMILLMEETLHQLISTLSHHLKGFIHSR